MHMMRTGRASAGGARAREASTPAALSSQYLPPLEPNGARMERRMPVEPQLSQGPNNMNVPCVTDSRWRRPWARSALWCRRPICLLPLESGGVVPGQTLAASGGALAETLGVTAAASMETRELGAGARAEVCSSGAGACR